MPDHSGPTEAEPAESPPEEEQQIRPAWPQRAAAKRNKEARKEWITELENDNPLGMKNDNDW